MSTPSQRRVSALQYLGERTGSLEYRFIRYAAVADELFANGMDDSSILADLGAGGCDFDFYLRTVRGWKGRYLPVDAAICGTDLDKWEPTVGFDFVVAIELIEHLQHPASFIERVLPWAGCFVVTTPNTDALGEQAVIEMDRTHISPIYESGLWAMQADRVAKGSFFGRGPADSLIATWRKK